MRIRSLFVALLFAAGCHEPTPTTPIDLVLSPEFAQIYTVVRGDSLSKIARRFDTTVDDLKAWNNRRSDSLEIGEQLLIWGAGQIGGDFAGVAVASVSRSHRSSSRRSSRTTRSAVVPAARPAVPEAVETKEAAPRPVPTFQRAGLLGALTEGFGSSDWEDALDSTSSVTAAVPASGTGLGQRSEWSSGTAEAGNVTIDRRIEDGPANGWGSGKVTVYSAQRPGGKRCLGGPSGRGLADDALVASNGLSQSQIKQGMRGVLWRIDRCVPGGTVGTHEIVAEVRVGCDGRVIAADVSLTYGAPAGVEACMVNAVKSASFAAHALPDGDSFRYPMTISR